MKAIKVEAIDLDTLDTLDVSLCKKYKNNF